MEKDFRVVVAGSRDFIDYAVMVEKLDALLINKKETHNIVIVSGCARGADLLGESYAEDRDYCVAKYPADWEQHGKRAGYLRNVTMAENADAVVVFNQNDSRGSNHMEKIAIERGLPTRVYRNVGENWELTNFQQN